MTATAQHGAAPHRRLAQAACVLLALALAGLAPASAQAQVEDYISNLTSTGGSGVATEITSGPTSRSFAQMFETGSQSSDYPLQEVVLHLDNIGAGAIRVTIRENEVNDRPGNTRYTLTNPTSLIAGRNTFTAPAGATLAADTRYHIVAESTGGAAARWLRTNRRSMLVGPFDTDWSIDFPHLKSFDSAPWAVDTRVFLVAVRGGDDGGGGNAAPTGVPTISDDTPMVGDTLTADGSGISDPDGPTSLTFTWRWLRVASDNTETPIPGATSKTYTVVAADVGAKLKVEASFTDNGGTAETVESVPTNTVQAASLPMVSVERVSSPVEEGEHAQFTVTRTVVTTGALTVHYRVSENGDMVASSEEVAQTVDFSGNTASLRVTVPTVDDTAHEADSTVTLTLTADAAYDLGTTDTTAEVTVEDNDNALPTGTVTISDTTPMVGDTLTATSTVSDPDGPASPTFTWRWLRVSGSTETPISGATSATYTVADADAGAKLKAEVSFTDDDGTAETVQSAATATVPAPPPPPPPPADVLVSNTGKTDNSLRDNEFFKAQSFTTGDAPGGYDLSSVVLEIANPRGRIQVTIRESKADGAPGDIVHDLGRSPSDEGGGLYEWQAPAGAMLEAGTDYHVVARDFSQPGQFRWWETTAEDGTDPGAASGWSIGGRRTSTGGTAWRDRDGSYQFQIRGTEASTNTAATGAPTIDNATPRVGDTLTADGSEISDADGPASPTFTWQWIRVSGGTETRIPSATSASYTVVAADLGATLKVEASFTDDGGTDETVQSAETAAVGEALPTVTVTPGTTPVTEGSDAVFRLARTGDTAARLQLFLSISETGDMCRGSSCAGATASATIPAGLASTNLFVKTSDDSDHEADSVVTVTLAANAAYELGTDRSAEVTVEDNDNAAPTGAPTIDNAAPRVGDTLTADASGVSDPDGPASLTFTWRWIRVSGGTGTPISGATSARYTVVAADAGAKLKAEAAFTDDDGTAETVESAETDTVGGAPLPVLSIGDASVAEGDTGSTTLDFTVTLDSAATEAVTVDWATSDGTATAGTDYTAGNGTLTFNAGDSSRTVSVTVAGDEVDEPDETFTVTLTNPSGATLGDDTATGTITNDDDDPTLTLVLTPDTITENGGASVLSATLDHASGRDTVVTVSVSPVGPATAADYSLSPNVETLELVIPAGDTASDGTFTITAVDNKVDAPHKTVTVSATAANEAGVTAPQDVTLTITDDDNAAPTGAPTISDTTPRVGDTLTADSSDISDADGPASPTFTWQWIRVSGGTETPIPGATSATYTVVAADLGAKLKVEASFRDDGGTDEAVESAETAAVGKALPVVTVTPETTPVTEGSRMVFRLARTGGTGATLFLRYHLSETGDMVAGSQEGGSKPISIPAGQASNRLHISTVDDGAHEADSVVTLTLEAGAAYELGADVSAEITVEDNDNAAPTGAPTIDNAAPRVGDTLTADGSGISDPDGLTGASFAWQWIRVSSGTDTRIPGAASDTYTVVAEDLGATLKAQASFTDDDGTEETVESAETAAVAAALPVVTVVSNGDFTEGIIGTFTLRRTGDTSSALWVLYEISVTGDYESTESTFRIVPKNSATVIVTLRTGDDGTHEPHGTLTLTLRPSDDYRVGTPGAATAKILDATNVAPTGAPTIDDTTPMVGDTLTADASGIDDADGLTGATFTWQWIRVSGGTETRIPGATSASYTVVAADAGATLKAEASFTDDGGTEETVESAATATVEAATLPTVTVTPRKTPVTEGDPAAEFTVTRTGDTTEALRVSISVSETGEMVSAGNEGGGTRTIPAGQPSAVISVPTVDDGVHEADSVVTLTLEANAAYELGTDATAEVTVEDDDDAPLPTVTVTPVTSPVVESEDAQFTVTRTGVTTGALRVRYNVIETGAMVRSGDKGAKTVDFSGDTASVTVTVPTVFDNVHEGNSRVTVALTADAAYELGTDATARVLVKDDDDSPATGTVTVTGTAREGETLTANTSDIADEDGGLDTRAYVYQWVRTPAGGSDEDISGATEATYVPVFADAGATLKVRVTVTDGEGHEATITSAATSAVAVLPTVTVASDGDVTEGSAAAFTLTRTGGSSAPWLIVNIKRSVSGDFGVVKFKTTSFPAGAATTRTRLHVADDEADEAHGAVTLTVLPGNGYRVGTPSAATAKIFDATNVAPTGAPTIDDTSPVVGEMLTADPSGIADADGLTNRSFTWQWVRVSGGTETPIDGATAVTYTVVAADVGATLKVKASFTDDGGIEETVESAATATVEAATLPTVTVTPRKTPVSEGDPAAEFTVTRTGDTTAALRVRISVSETGDMVSAGNEGGGTRTIPAGQSSAVISVPTVDDGVHEADSVVTLTLAANAAYELGTDATAEVTVEDDDDPPVVSVAPVASPVVESEDAQFTVTRTGVTTGALRVRYNVIETGAMVRSGDKGAKTVDFSGDTASVTVTVPTVSDNLHEGNSRVTVALEADAAYELGTEATARVLVKDDDDSPATGTVTVTGTAREGETLTANTSDIADEDGGLDTRAYVYQWVRTPAGGSDAAISGATEATYVPVFADAGATLKVKVTVTDGEGHEATFTSAPTSAVAALPRPEVTVVSAGDVTEGSPALFTLTRTGATAETLDVAYAVTATGNFGVTPGAGTATFLANDATVQVSVGTTGDGAHETHGTVTVTLTADTGADPAYLLGDPATATAAVEDDDDSPATGAVTITGTATEGETLSADTSGLTDGDGLDNAAYVYQWVRTPAGGSDADISGATGATYVPVFADAGAKLKVRVTVTDDEGHEATITSAATSAVAALPRPEVTVASDGDVTEGSAAVFTLTRTGATAETLDVAYAVTATGDFGVTPGAGTATFLANSATVQVTVATTGDGAHEAHGTVTVTLTADTGADPAYLLGDPATATAAVEDDDNAAPTGAVTIDDTTPVVGETLTADASSLDDPDGLTSRSFTWQWLRVSGGTETEITGATAVTYTVVAADVGATLKVKASFTDDGGTDETVESAQTSAAEPPLPVLTVAAESELVIEEEGAVAFIVTRTTDVDLSRSLTVNFRVRHIGGTFTSGTLTFAANQSTLRVGGSPAGDVDGDGTVVMTLLDGEGYRLGTPSSATVTVWDDDSVPTVSVADADAVTEGETVTFTLTRSGNRGRTFTVAYETTSSGDFGAATGAGTAMFLANDAAVQVSVATTDDSVHEAHGSVTLTLTADGEAYNLGAQAASTAAVLDDDDSPATGAVTITGTAREGETLTANTSGVEDADGLSAPAWTYQWVRTPSGGSDADISGATGATYVPVFADAGATLKVRVTVTDDEGHQATFTSAATSAVAVLPRPSVTVASGGEVTEGETVTFTLTRTGGTGDTSGTLDVAYMVTASGDFGAATGADTATFPANRTTVQVSVTTTDDGAHEEHGSVTLTLTPNPEAYNPGAEAAATAAVLDDDNAAPTGAVTIDGTVPVVGQTLRADASGVDDPDGLTSRSFTWQWLRVSGGTETVIAGASTASYTVAAADVGVMLKVRVGFTDDDGTGETVESAPTGAVSEYTITVASPRVTEGDAGSALLDFALTRSETGQRVELGWRVTTEGTAQPVRPVTDFAGPMEGTLVFSPNTRSRSVYLQVVPDIVDETDETVVLEFFSVAGTPEGVTFPARVTGTIVDDDTATLSIAPWSVDEGDSGTRELVFTVSLDLESDREVTVEYDVGGTAESGADYEAPTPVLVTFPALFWEPQRIVFRVHGDTDAERHETVTVELRDPSGGVALGTSQATATIRNDDGLVVSVDPPEVAEGDSRADGARLTFRLELSGQADTDVTVDYRVDAGAGTATPGADFKDKSGTATIKSGRSFAVVKLGILEDTAAEPDETVVMVFENPRGAVLYPDSARVTGTILDDDLLQVNDDLPLVTVAAESGPVTEGEDAVFVLTRTGDTSAPLTVTVDVSQAGRVLAGTAPTEATFGADEAQTRLRVATEDDATAEADGRVTATVIAGTGYTVAAGAGTAGVDVFDDDAPAAPEETATLWSTTMTVADLGGSVGASGADLADPDWSEDGVEYAMNRLRWLGSPKDRVVVRFNRRPPLAEELTLHAGELTLALAEGGSGRVLRWPVEGEPWSVGEEVALRLTRTVAGADPDGAAGAGISVADARVNESAGRPLAFRVTLAEAQSSAVSVRYATSDGSAVAGADYVAASGMVRFEAGETVKTVEVAVLEDAHDEGEETLTLTLTRPFGAEVSDGVATGTIVNTDAMPRAWLGRFGRTVAGQVVDAVEARMTAAREAGVEVSIAGRRVEAGGAFDEAAFRGGGAAGGRVAGWLAGETGPGAFDMAALRDGGVAGGFDSEGRPVSGRELLTGTSFALTEGTAESGFVSLWGRGVVTDFDGRDGGLSVDGKVRTGLLGADWARGDWAAGLMVGHSRGEGNYGGQGAGTVSSSLTGLYPWGRHELNERVTVWGVAGYGVGTLTLEPEGGARIKTDMDLAMAAAGLRGVLMEAPAEGGFELAAKTDGLIVRTSSEAARGGDGGMLEAARGQVTRLRLGLEGTRAFRSEGGWTLTPSFGLGVRHDGGDAETGFGVEVGAGVAYADPSSGLTADLRGRGLLAHEASGFREVGFSGSLVFDPSPTSDRGLSLSLSQTVGASATGGVDALYGRDTMAGLGGTDAGAVDSQGRRRLEARVGYGVATFGGRFTGTPELGFGLSESGRDYRLGWRLTPAGDNAGSFELSVEATRREDATGDDAPEHGVGVWATIRW